MKKFFGFIIRQSVAIVLIVILVLALGVYCTVQMPINLLPDIEIPMVCVQVIYVGANAQSAETDVTEPLEEGLSAISGVTSVDSYSYDNLSAVVLSFDYGTDTSEKKTEIQSKLSSISLPDDVITSVYDIDLNSEALATLSVTSSQSDDEMENLELAYKAAQELSSKLSAIDGVESVDIKGGADYSYLIQPYGGLELIAPLIVEAFSYGDYDLPLGSVTEDDLSVQIRNTSDVASYEDIENMPITLPSSMVTLLEGVREQMIPLLGEAVYEHIASSIGEEIYSQIDSQLQANSTMLRLLGYTYPDDIAEIMQNSTVLNTIHNTLKASSIDLSDDILTSIMVDKDYAAVTDAGADFFNALLADSDYNELIHTGIKSAVGTDLSDEILTSLLACGKYSAIDDAGAAFYAGLLANESYSEEIHEGIQSAMDGADYSNELLYYILAEADFDAATEDGLTVHISDIATITNEETFSSYVYYSDGEFDLIHGTVIEIYKSNGANSTAVVKSVKKIFEDYMDSDITYGAEVKLLDDQSDFISSSINNVLVSMVIGAVLAVIVIFLFLKKVRTSLIIAITMPLSVLAALLCLYLMGITLNMVSLGGLAVGIGMLVDNSIVVIESISLHRDRGKNAYRAAVDGTTEVGGALFGSTLTTICVFVPIIFTGGLTAEIFVDLAWAVIYSLGFSFIIAVTVIPALYVLFSGQRRRLLNGGKPARELALAGNTPYDSTPAAAEGDAYGGTAYAGEETDAGHAEAAFAGAAAGMAAAAVLADSTPAGEGPESAGPASGGPGEGGSGSDGTGNDGGKGRKGNKRRRFVEWFRKPNFMTPITHFYGRILPAVLNRKLITIIVAIVVFGASIGLLFLTGTEFLPSIDKGQIEINMSYPATAQLEEKQEDVYEFANIIKNNVDNIDYVSVNIGKNGLLALTDTGLITVQLTTSHKTSRVVSQIRQLAQDSKDSGDITGSVTVKEVDGVVASLTSGMSDLSVTIVGDDGDTLNEIAAKIEEKLIQNGFDDVTDSAADSSYEYNLTFDRYEMERRGLDYSTLILTLRIGIASYTACTVTLGTDTYDIDVQFDNDAIVDKQSLLDFVVGYEAVTDDSGNTTGVNPIHLKDILVKATDDDGNVIMDEDDPTQPAYIVKTETAACIRRTNGQQMISVSASKNSTDTGTASTEMQNIAKEVLKSYDGYSFEVSGIGSYLSDAFSGLILALVISLFLLYAVMAIQFSSGIKPLIIMASIPFSFTGGFIFLVITGSTLNVVSFIGLIMLMGVVVNNAIVMLEKIKQLHEAGMQHYYAVQEACKTRLRPILMTTLTTILALIPIAIGIGQGSELMQPLGIVVIGGLLIGTLVTLVLIPTIYSAVHHLSKEYPEGKKAAKLAARAAAEAAAAAAAAADTAENSNSAPVCSLTADMTGPADTAAEPSDTAADADGDKS
ncbi:MAG: efflux RND transporter permease subunit [Clostridia bacterium]|nr:efflux RND transporter permease subunit [Clostridia bacterium]